MDHQEDEVSEAADTLLRAEEIKKDPELMAQVKEYLDEKKDDIASIQDLRDKAKDMEEEGDSGDSGDDEEDLPPKELWTEEDKASIQQIRDYKKKANEMTKDAKTESKIKE